MHTLQMAKMSLVKNVHLIHSVLLNSKLPTVTFASLRTLKYEQNENDPIEISVVLLLD